jgi:hypothetical protein
MIFLMLDLLSVTMSTLLWGMTAAVKMLGHEWGQEVPHVVGIAFLSWMIWVTMVSSLIRAPPWWCPGSW